MSFDAPPESNASYRKAHVLNQRFDELKGEMLSILGNESTYLETISRLQSELALYKRAYEAVDADHKHAQQAHSDALAQLGVLETQLKGGGYRVVILIDGDGAIFTPELISQGAVGGHIAAEHLSNGVSHYMTEAVDGGPQQYQVWVYVFLNKRGLVEALGRYGHSSAKTKFDEFAMGFNQATERFVMVDVGSGKEAADAKIKAHLEDDIRLPQTSKIMFAGCHDNGYVANLRSQITAGYKSKLVLLKSYTDMAVGISDLDLPSFSIPDLFMSQKLGPSAPSGLSKSRRSSSVVRPSSLPTLPPSPPLEPVCMPTATRTPSPELQKVAAAADCPEPIVVKRPAPASPRTYSFALKTTKMMQSGRPPTPELEAGGSSSSEDSEDLDAVVSNSFTSLHSTPRQVDSSLPLSKQKPAPPCTLFYLANCKHGSTCKYAHDFVLQEEHYREMSVNAKKAPCPAVNKGEECTWGENCVYSHTCPQASKCVFLKRKKCKFVGGSMHKEADNQ